MSQLKYGKPERERERERDRERERVEDSLSFVMASERANVCVTSVRVRGEEQS